MKLGLHNLQYWDLPPTAQRAVEKWSIVFPANPARWVACVELLNELGTHVKIYTVDISVGPVFDKQHARSLIEAYPDRIISAEYKGCSPFPPEAIQQLPDDLFALSQ
jgi:hypothetical protein